MRDVGWRSLGMVADGDPFMLDGVDVWTVEWVPQGRRVEVRHPTYPWQVHALDVYRLGGPDGAVFAAGELSAGGWGFFVPA